MSRKEVIKLLKLIKSTVYLGNRKFLDALEFAINYLNQPEQRWILCSERLPKKYGNYLITTGEGEVDLGSYDPDRPGSWSACDAKGFHWVGDVVAWRPLPDPYREDGEADDR